MADTENNGSSAIDEKKANAEAKAEERKKQRAAVLKAHRNVELYLSNFGKYIILIFVSIAMKLGSGIAASAKFVYRRSGNITSAFLKKASYAFLLLISPFVKTAHALKRARRDIKENKKEKGTFAAVKIAASHLGSFVFGNTGIAVTIFNIAAPIICIAFLFNIVSYASDLRYCVKLTVNGKFLGYIENEQIYYDADEILKDRINYLGSAESLRLEPQFSIELTNSAVPLTKYQVADIILDYSDISVEYAYGFYLNGVFLGAIPDNEPVKRALDTILDKYSASHPNAKISFRDKLEYETAGLYLSGSIIDTDWLISQLTSIKTNAGYYIAEADDTLETVINKTGLTVRQLEMLNHGITENSVFEGQRIKIREEIPFLSVNVSVVEEYDVDVNYSTEYYNDDSLYSGVTRVTTEGVPGVDHYTADVTYVNNIETSRRVTNIRTVSDPVTEMIALGTKTPPEQYSPEDAGYGKFIWPMDVGKSHISELTQWDGGYAGHLGIDIVEYYGAPIYAGASGTVILAGWNYGYGNCVIIDHGNGYQTLYGHCSEVLVSVGEQVIQGQNIAKEGSTGVVTGPHLHFEVRMGKVKLNPISYLEHVYYG